MADECAPFSNNFSSACEYVRANKGVCEGGGYMLWTELELCSGSPLLQAFVVVLALLFFFYLFVLLTTTADDFFCSNIAVIIDHHKISQNVAGITIMAFGNGAPDIFGSIASVISGGGLIVTTVVLAAIVLVKPFDVMRRPVIRDILFYLLALALLTLIVIYDTEIHLWQPCLFLFLYVVYAFTVISGGFVRQRIRKQKHQSRLMTNAVLKFSGILPKKTRPNGAGSRVAPVVSAKDDFLYIDPNGLSSVKKTEVVRRDSEGHREFIVTPATLDRGGKVVERSVLLPKTFLFSTTSMPVSFTGSLIIPIGQTNSEEKEAEEYMSATEYLEAGKFFVKEGLDNEEASVTTTSTLITPCESGDKIVVAAASDIDPQLRLPSSYSSASTNFGQVIRSRKATMKKFGRHVSPLDVQEFHEANLFLKVYHLFKIPCMVFLKVSVPLATVAWYKPLVLLHSFVSPLVFCAAFKVLDTPLIPDGSVFTCVWALTLVFSTILSLFVLIFTKADREPKYYKQLAAYSGFVMSIAWIYAAAAEVVNVVLMFGNIFNISYQILGLTAISWCNSIGDLVADVSVARQGFPRMAFSATIGAPLFNLLVGFGATFLIAKMKGKTVTVAMDKVKITMFITLAISLISTLIILFLQRFQLKRPHGIFMIVLYLAFLVIALLVNQKII